MDTRILCSWRETRPPVACTYTGAARYRSWTGSFLRRQPQRRDPLHRRRQPSGGGEEGVRRILLNDDGQAKTLLQLVREKTQAQGREPADNVDLRIGTGPDGRVFLLNKFDGTIRMLVP